MQNKTEALADILRAHRPLLIAYSGGVDSTFLLAFARKILGKENVLGVIADSPSFPRQGLADAALNPDDVDFISAHATATKMGDVIEAQATHAIYGDRPLVTGFKGYMGHTMGTCGVIETLLCLYLMQEGFVAPTLNLEEVDERCAMVCHTPGVEERQIRVAAVQNFAFGGVNTSLLIRRFP